MLKTVIKRAAIGVVLAVVAIIGAEGASSLFMLAVEARSVEPPPANFRQAVHDTLLGWVGLPNLAIADNWGSQTPLTTNAEGLRIHRPAPATGGASGEQRILCSGDSFTYGAGVGDDDTFCARLEHAMPGVRTVNIAHSGYGIDQMYLRYLRDGGRYPHQVHLFGFIWHDFERMTMETFFGYAKPVVRLEDGRLVPDNVPVPEWKGYTRWSAVGALLPRARLMQLAGERPEAGDSTQMARVDAQVQAPAEAIFRELARLGKERGSTQVLVYLTSPPDLTPGPNDIRRAKVAEMSRKAGIPLIDLTEEMRRLPADTAAWMFITANALRVRGSALHYTPKGHAWVAERLAAHLRALPLAVPPATAAASAPTAAASTPTASGVSQ
jgi:hypothetical protein